MMPSLEPQESRVAEHRSAFELLPWLVNGSLDGDERRWVERHVEECETCRLEMKLLSAVGEVERQVLSTPVSAHPARIHGLMQRLDKLERRPWRRLLAGQGRGGREPSADASWWPGWVLIGAQAVLVVAVSTVVLIDRWPSRSGATSEGAEYRTLAQPSTAAPSRPTLRVVFAEDVTEVARRELMESIGGEVVAGPSRLGVFTIVLLQAASGRGVDELLVELRADPRVRFAEWDSGASRR